MDLLVLLLQTLCGVLDLFLTRRQLLAHSVQLHLRAGKGFGI